MKRTTYILIGLLAFGLVAMCGIMLYIYAFHTETRQFRMEIGGETKTVSLSPCRVLELRLQNPFYHGAEEPAVYFQDVPLYVRPAEEQEGTLSFAGEMEQFIDIRQNQDTVCVLFHFPKDRLAEAYQHTPFINLSSWGIELHLPSDTQSILSSLTDQTAFIEGLRSDTLSLQMAGHVHVNDCQFGALYAERTSMELHSGCVDRLHLLTDNMKWTVHMDAFSIGTEYLSGYHTKHIYQDGSGRMVWTPLGEDAALLLRLDKAAEVIQK